MKRKSFLILFIIISIILNSCFISSASSFYTFTDFYDFLGQYQTTNEGEKPILINEYITWQNSSGGGFPAIINATHAVFIYYNSSESISTCIVAIDVFHWENYTMTQLEPGVSFFYRAFTFQPSTRANYVFFIDGNHSLDLRNPYKAKENLIDSEYGVYDSEMALPPFEREYYYIYNSSAPQGTLTPLTNFSSDPYVQIYLPANYNSNTEYPVVYFADGYLYTDIMDTKIILDNLIAAEKIKPLIALFADWIGFDPNHPSDSDWEQRSIFYRNKNIYLAFLDDLINYTDSYYPTIETPYARLHLGLSGSGYASAYTPLYRSDMIKLAAVQSAGPNNLVDQLSNEYENTAPSLDLKIWICAGTYEYGEGWNTTRSNEEIYKACKGNGWETELYLSAEAHTFAFWQHTLDDILVYFFPNDWISPPYTPPTITSTTTTTATTIPNWSFILLILIVTVCVSKKQQKYRYKK